ncbi:MAG: tetratricopeptide repeat protein [Gemmatimonadaceae bacterium]|nr:tetratricopeptide repeat protein [Gemmatimonadaceae bacterium]
MAIRGSLKEASLPDVLQLLSMGKKTGCLSVTHRSNFGSIYFDKGKISYASIVNRRDRLGDILMKSGVITQEQLEEGIAAQAHERDKRLGEILVDRRIITRDDLHRQIRLQIEEAVYFLFTWTQGTFNFEADIRPEEQDFLVSINPESLLLEGARRVDEWSLIEKKIPSFDIVFELDRRRLTDSGVALTAEQEVVVPLIDGRRDVATLVDETGMVEFEVGKALYGLVTAGFLHRVGKSTKTAETAAPDARVEEHRNLGAAFYKAGMLDESVREFRRVLDLRSTDAAARFYLGLVHMRQGKFAEAVADFQAVTSSRGAKPAAFHNLALALEQMGRLDEARVALQEAVKRGGAQDPRVLMALGVLHLRAGDAAAADAALMEARPLFTTKVPGAVWFHYAALAAALGGHLDKAISLLGEGTQTHPHAATLFNNLAVALESKGRADEAKTAAENGLHEDAGLPQLHKNLGDLFYKAGQLDDALESYQRAVKFSERLGPDVWRRLGNIRMKRDEKDEAIRCWEMALSIDPADTRLQANLETVRGQS